MNTWSLWTLDAARNSQDPNHWHVYSAEMSGGEYTGNYDQKQYPRLLFPEYVV
jgi:hypothetical protein